MFILVMVCCRYGSTRTTRLELDDHSDALASEIGTVDSTDFSTTQAHALHSSAYYNQQAPLPASMSHGAYSALSTDEIASTTRASATLYGGRNRRPLTGAVDV